MHKRELTPAEINKLPRSGRPINCAELTAEQIAVKYADRRRVGKTAKDRRRKA